MTDAQREPLADFVIDNIDWEEIAVEVKKLYHTFLVRFMELSNVICVRYSLPSP